jgi:hypothetical protein
MRRVIWWLIVILIVITTIAGLWNGFWELQDTQSSGERMVSAAVLCYGITGLIVLFAMIRKRSWIMIPLIVWSVAVAFAGTAAPWVYSPDEGRWIGTVASGICTIALLTFIAFQVRRETSSWS